MGIVLNQSFKNTLILVLGFTIGGINALFLYTHFLKEEYYGLVIFLLSTANILLPLVAFGMQHSVVKYFSSYKTKLERDSLLSWSLILPMLIIIPIGFIGVFTYETISSWISAKNSMIKDYTYIIFLCAIFMGYFEVFYSWTKVQMNSVFGNFIKEIFARVGATLLLFCLYMKLIDPKQFIYGITIVYFLRMLIMKLYAYSIYLPKFTFNRPNNFKEILRYSMYLILAGSAATLLLEIDKFMIPQFEGLSDVAYYSVGIFIASVVAIPSRAMQQITSPITAKDLNENNIEKVEVLYKQSSINLLIVGGILFLLINLNITEMYEIINRPQYSVGVWIVLMISFSELFKLALGTNGAILTNSKFYKVFFYFSLGMALSVVVLNHILIRKIGINGAALATLITILIFNTIKILYVKRKFNIQPFSSKTIVLLILIFLLYIGFFYVDFPFHPLINIILKCILVSIVYFSAVLKLSISNDFNNQIELLFTKKK
ncbi:oligosaccharide flippase family protein [Urechidicola croceus]|uniref:Sugar isomerase n=1 Tax=Urechidicola croceus TaxID=1850246 RepID=A0A1D8PBI3_9FLAO|nr:oligosaccharide flippase family protein [Urechidicola croceus]AOW21934.1 sugar isomerase [Urechidicola croceus]